MVNKKGQTSVLYMAFFILMGVVFLGLTFAISSDFKDESISEISGYLSESIFTDIEKTAIEIKAIENQTSPNETISKTTNIPHKLGDREYQIIGDETRIILHAAGNNAIYKTHTIYWPEANITGSVNSQNRKLTLTFNTSNNELQIS
jgi:hypothetical protein